MLREGAPGGRVSGADKSPGQAEHRIERIGVGRTEDAAAAVDPLGQDLACSGIFLHGDQHAAEVGHRPQSEGVLRSEDAALRLQQLLERRPGRGVVAQGTMSQAEVVEGAQSCGIVGAEGIAAAVVDAFVHGSGDPGLLHERKRHGQTMDRGEGVEVTRSKDALRAFHENRVGIASGLVLLELDRDRRKTGFDLDRGRVIRPEKLASGLQDLPENRSLGPGVFDSFEEDTEVLQCGEAGNYSSRAAG